jgi:hypothetical protein
MPKSTVEKSEIRLLPEDKLFRARLNSVTAKTIEWADKATGEAKSAELWEWEFEVMEGEYAGVKVWGETDAKLTNHPDNKPRNWAETLQGKELEVGEEFNTDDVVGLIADIEVQHKHYMKNGEERRIHKIRDVVPALSPSSHAAPPF